MPEKEELSANDLEIILDVLIILKQIDPTEREALRARITNRARQMKKRHPSANAEHLATALSKMADRNTFAGLKKSTRRPKPRRRLR